MPNARLVEHHMVRLGEAHPRLRCHCGGERKVLAVVSEPHAVQEALKSLGLPSTKAGVAPARWPTQDELDLPRDYGGLDPSFFDQVA